MEGMHYGILSNIVQVVRLGVDMDDVVVVVIIQSPVKSTSEACTRETMIASDQNMR
jgi:hypothetical protein